jgi:hypothetical protein
MSSSPFDTLAQRIREEFREAVTYEIRRYKWTEGEKGRDLSWEEVPIEWIEAHRENLGQFLMSGMRRYYFENPLGFEEADSAPEPCAPQDERTTSPQSRRISRAGISGDAIRSNIAATAATPIARQG